MDIALLVLSVAILATVLAIAFRLFTSKQQKVTAEVSLEPVVDKMDEQFRKNRTEATEQATALQQNVRESIAQLGKTQGETLKTASENQKNQLESFESTLKRVEQATTEQGEKLQKDTRESIQHLGKIQSEAMNAASQQQGDRLESFEKTLEKVEKSTTAQGEKLRQTVDTKLKEMREDNTTELDKIRKTVDEKLQHTLERKLGESFKSVSDQLKSVNQSFGEMRNLATGVDDLRGVLTNVQQRGAWGEMRLESTLQSTLDSRQWGKQEPVDELGNEQVDFIIRVPTGEGNFTLLPIDSKFPSSDYEKIVEARKRTDKEALNSALRELEKNLERKAKSISQKYINPPHTTNFAIMYLPSEGLFAEVASNPELLQRLERDYRIQIAGPTSIMAILNTIRMAMSMYNFQMRADEIHRVLGAVTKEFATFGDALHAARRSIEKAHGHMDKMDTRTRQMNRALKKAQALESPKGITLEIENSEEENDFGDESANEE